MQYLHLYKNINVTFSLVQITGHKRVESLNNYCDLAEEEEIAIGRVLGRPEPSNYHVALQRGDTDQDLNMYEVSDK